MTKKVWIEAYWIDGNPMLGNGDGQGCIVAKDYRRTAHYRAVRSGRFSRPAYWRVVDDNGRRLETIYPSPPPLTIEDLQAMREDLLAREHARR